MYLRQKVEVGRDHEGDHDGQIPFVAPSHTEGEMTKETRQRGGGGGGASVKQTSIVEK